MHVGACNTAVDFLVFWLASEWVGISVYHAQILAYCTATCNSYLLNSRFTFRNRRGYSWRQFGKFVTVNLASLTTSLLLLYLFNGIMGWDKMTVKVIIAPFTFSINYLGNRLWVFHAKK